MSSKCFKALFVATALFRFALGECQSWGWDFVDGGQGYYINTLETAPFEFGTIFEGMIYSPMTEQLMLSRIRMCARRY
jgi:hypothetical protein